MAKARASRERSQENQPPAFATAHLAALIESTQDLIWSVDLDFRLVSFNKALSDAFARGFGVKIAAGTTPRDLLPSKKGAGFPSLYEKALREGPCSAEYRLEDGRCLEMAFNPIIQDGRKVGVSVFGKDVTQQKSAEEELRRTAEQYREIFEFAPEAIFRTTQEGKVLTVNPAGAKLFGFDSPAEAIAAVDGQKYHAFFDLAERSAFLETVNKEGEARSGPTRFNRKDGTLIWGIITARRIRGPDGKTLYYQGFLEDVTERKRAEETLRESEERYRRLFENSQFGIYRSTPVGQVVLVNPSLLAMLGYTSNEELAQRNLENAGFEPGYDRRWFKETLERDGFIRNHEATWTRRDGKTLHVLESAVAVRDSEGAVLYYDGTVEDITERKAAEEALQKAEQQYREIFENAPEGIFQATKEGRSLALNPAGAKLLGFSSSGNAVASITDSAHDVWLNPEDRARYTQLLEEQGEIYNFPCQLKRSDGTPIWVSLSARRVCGQDGQTLYHQGFIEDLTEQRRLEAALRGKIRELQILSEINNALLRATTEEDLLAEYCRIIVDVGGYLMAWVGFAEEGPEKRIIPVAHYGHEDGYLKLVNVTWADTERGRGATARAIRSGEVQLVEDVSADPAISPWRGEALRRGYMSAIALPFYHSEGSMACLTAHGAMRRSWSESERGLMEQVALDLGFGIKSLRTGLAKAQFQESLRVSLEQTIEVIAETVEQRDPYTAGHQRRVADLCVAIAGKLGLSSERTQGLRLAASIHDLGKIGVPAEILAKPGRLTDIQVKLIKEHAQLGYEIIKNVQFPWPIAQMILQHHERLDGSGYPQGLKAEEIFLEARILAVADVVEAMNSHRPYRPSRGIDEALDEVLAKSGTLYDSAAVEACVNLFRHEGYEFPAQ